MRSAHPCRVLEDRLTVSQGRFRLKATVGPLGLKAGDLLSMVVCASLRSIGFHAITLNKTQTPLDLLRNSEELGADLVIPLLAHEDVEGQLRGLMEEVDRGGFKTRFEIIPVASRLPRVGEYSLSVARNSGEAISKATEWALKRRVLRRAE